MFVVLSSVILGGTAMPVASASAQELAFARYRLQNGLTVILHEDHTIPKVAVNIWYYVGAKDEPAGRSGFAHLFEHLMFMGTDRVPYPRFDTSMERFGGSNNATTSADRTNYFESGPPELLETFLFLEADRMAYLGAGMTAEKLETQREVVRNERRQQYENRPYGGVELELPEYLYPSWHPYREPVIGSHADLEAATVDDVREFFREFYFPANASLVIAGDFDPAEARRLVEKHFGPLERRPPIVRPTVPPPALDRVVRRKLSDDVELPLVVYVWPSPRFYAEGDAHLDVIAACLGEGKSSRLYRRLVHETELAQSVVAYQLSRQLVSEFRVEVLARPGVSLHALESELNLVLEDFRRTGPTDAEIARARNRLDIAFWQSAQSLTERADLLNRYQFYLGNPGAVRIDRARYERVTAKDTRRWAVRVLRPNARVHLRVVPRQSPEDDGSSGEAAP